MQCSFPSAFTDRNRLEFSKHSSSTVYRILDKICAPPTHQLLGKRLSRETRAVHLILWLLLFLLVFLSKFLISVYCFSLEDKWRKDMKNGRKSDWFHIVEKKIGRCDEEGSRWEKGVQKRETGSWNRIKRAATYLKWRRRRRTGKVNISAHSSVMSGLDGAVVVPHRISWICRRQRRRRRRWRRRRWSLAVIRRLMMVIDAAAATSLQAPQGVKLNYVRTNQTESIHVLTASD